MALEIELESAQELSEWDLLEFLAQRCDAELVDRFFNESFLRTPGMEIRTYRVAPKGRELKEGMIGFRRKISVRFGIRKFATLDKRDAAWETMLRLVIAFARQYPAEAVLLFEGEKIRMRCRNSEIILDTTDYFQEIPNLAAIVSQHRQETLDQPFM